ncbi:MAG TPA: hypothetical protein VFM54_12775, partial [Micromonosporaceae bacterium]|nr:hypothetical protein [Micromonosporaceae bacterium]
ALVGGSQVGDRVVVVDMPADMGGRVSSVLWMRSVPAVVFAVQRLVYVHPYRYTRWCFLATADSSRRYDNLSNLPVPLLRASARLVDLAGGLGVGAGGGCGRCWWWGGVWSG